MDTRHETNPNPLSYRQDGILISNLSQCQVFPYGVPHGNLTYACACDLRLLRI